MMYSTLLLNPLTWDLTVDNVGNIATVAPPYAVAQDVASACRLFRGELWYDTTKGVPYFETILGKKPPPGLIKSAIEAAARTVPGVVTASLQLTHRGMDRVQGGVLLFTDETGATHSV